MYAIITFRHTGPIKSWAAMRATNVHNARTKPLAHAMPDAPAPKHLIGGPDLVADVKRSLKIVKIDPDKLRKNGVIAYEAILSASPAFFDIGSPEERAARLNLWTAAQVEWAKKKYSVLRIVSMVLHTDEKTPHIHLVILPLEVKRDKRRKDAEVRWGLVGRTISGPGQFDRIQDGYAEAMAAFGLVRGVRGSGRKHEPVPVYLKRMAEKEQAVDVERASLVGLREGVERDRALVDAGAAKVNAAWRQIVAQRAQEEAAEADLARRIADHDERVRRDAAAMADEKREFEQARQALRDRQATNAAAGKEVARRAALIEADRLSVQRDHEALVEARTKFRAHRDQVEVAQVAVIARRDAVKVESDRVEAGKERLLSVFSAAQSFLRQARAVPESDLTPRATAAVTAAHSLRQAAMSLSAPASEVDAGVLAQFAQMRAAGRGIGA